MNILQEEHIRQLTQLSYVNHRLATTHRPTIKHTTFSGWFHAWSRVHRVAKQTVSWHCVSHHSCI